MSLLSRTAISRLSAPWPGCCGPARFHKQRADQTNHRRRQAARAEKDDACAEGRQAEGGDHQAQSPKRQRQHAAHHSSQPLLSGTGFSALALAGGVVASVAVTTALSPSVTTTAALLQLAFAATSVLFIGYGLSHLVESTNSTLQPVGATFNAARKGWCSALQWAHACYVALALSLAALALQADSTGLVLKAQAAAALALPQLAQQLLAAWWPLLVVSSVNLGLLCWVELHKPLVRKARMQELDIQAPGRAHPFMVQGAQTAARLFVWVALLAVNIVLACLDMGRGLACTCIVALAALGAAWTTVEEQDSELNLPRASLAHQQQAASARQPESSL